ncbi:hypothetical protein VaNZ11_006240 [Volvox africanus]|uniref:Protein kinase domain-containing protein n=1 Tax=Volvox africanus TaxID=51714 RepID=A0ABQ5S140_9CHLO|nr:hypothetical protein VaNZ11_006240 [Volvox africanus]
MAPGLDILAAGPLPQRGFGDPYWPAAIGDNVAYIQRTCVPLPYQLNSSGSIPRPVGYPGNQTSEVNLPQSACTQPAPTNNSVAASLHPMQRCWPMVGLYEDLATFAFNLDSLSRQAAAGYLVVIRHSQYFCETLMSDDCAKQYTPAGCFLRMFPRSSSNSSTGGTDEPPPISTTRPPPSIMMTSVPTIGTADSKSPRVPLGLVLGATLGGTFVVCLAAAIIAFIAVKKLRRSHYHHQLQQQQQQHGGGAPVCSWCCTLLLYHRNFCQNVGCCGGNKNFVPAGRDEADTVIDLKGRQDHHGTIITAQLSTAGKDLSSSVVPSIVSGSQQKNFGALASAASFRIESSPDPLSLVPVTSLTPLHPGINLDVKLDGGELTLSGVTLGRGAFGRVVKGTYGGVPVAVKLIDHGLGPSPRQQQQQQVKQQEQQEKQQQPQQPLLHLQPGADPKYPGYPAGPPLAATQQQHPAASPPVLQVPPPALATGPTADGVVAAAPMAEALPQTAAPLIPNVTVSLSAAGAGGEGACGSQPRVNTGGGDGDAATVVVQQQLETQGAGPRRPHGDVPRGEEAPLSSRPEVQQQEDHRPIAAACQGDEVIISHASTAAADAIIKHVMAAAAVSSTGSRDDDPRSRCNMLVPLSAHVRGGGAGGGAGVEILGTDYVTGSKTTTITAGDYTSTSSAALVDSSRDANLHGDTQMLPLSSTTSTSNPRSIRHATGEKSATKGGAVPAVVKGLPQQPSAEDVPNSLQATLKQEVEVLARCQHPNIVCLHAACLKPPWLCLVMELMDTSLDRLLYGEKRLLPLDTVLHIAIQIARGLSYLHPTIVHRDLKPGNVLISNASSSRPIVKLADFGLSRLRNSVLITKNPEVGTAPYIAPEAFESKNFTITDRVDVYALGIMMWEMLSGRRPWTGHNMVVIAIVVAMHQRRPPLGLLSDERCPPKLRSLITACWDPDPVRRPAAAEVAKRLTLVQEALNVGERLTESPPRKEHQGPLPI